MNHGQKKRYSLLTLKKSEIGPKHLNTLSLAIELRRAIYTFPNLGNMPLEDKLNLRVCNNRIVLYSIPILVSHFRLEYGNSKVCVLVLTYHGCRMAGYTMFHMR